MSNPSPESVPDDSEPVRSTQPLGHSTSTGTKKKSGFVITSVTDSGHGRPASIARDGEESADDLDESHTSYSDISYSRTTDADHDQESTASEDTLNISAHESAGTTAIDGPSVVNHIGVSSHHHPQHSHPAPQHHHVNGNLTGNKSHSTQDTPHSSQSASTMPHNTAFVQGGTLTKQHSDNLESPQELPHDNMIGEAGKDVKLKENERLLDKGSSTGLSAEAYARVSNMKVSTTNSSSGSEQSHDNTNATSTIPAAFTPQPTPPTASNAPATSTSAERPTVLNAAAVTAASTTSKAVTSAASSTSGKVTGTRVYKIVKRDTHQPVKRNRGRWNWYDFSDQQAPMVNLLSQSVSDSRISQVGTQLQNMNSNTGPYALQQSDSTSSVLKEQLMRTGFPSNSSFNSSTSSMNWETEMKKQYAAYAESGLTMKAEDRDSFIMGPDALKSAMKNVSRMTGDASTGDISSSTSRSLKIDNKIEAAMDLVKKHLMSAVRDEVDELKEKIKDLQEENVRLKSEAQVLRSAIPSELQSQLQVQLPPRRDASAKEKKTTFENHASNVSVMSVSSVDSVPSVQSNASMEHSMHKGTNQTPVQVMMHQADGKVKVNSVPIQRQDTSKMMKSAPNSQPTHQTHIISNIAPGTQYSIQGAVKIPSTAAQGQKPPGSIQIQKPGASSQAPKAAAGQVQKPVAGAGQGQKPVAPAGQGLKPAVSSHMQQPGLHNDLKKSDSTTFVPHENSIATKNPQTAAKATDNSFVKKNPS